MQSRLSKLALALALGTAGGALAYWARMPLAWMIGAMLATTAGAIAGAPLSVPTPLRGLFVAVLGVMLGSSFRPELLDRLDDWVISLSGLTVYIALCGWLGYLFLNRFGSYGRATAYFGSMPGGLSEMILVGSSVGGDARVISFLHASRILFVVLALPIAFQFLMGYEPGTRQQAGTPLAEAAWEDLGVLLLCAVVGGLLARLARLPAWQLVGPMLVSAGLHLGGLTEASPPTEIIAASQVVIGTAVGCRFANTPLRFVARAIFFAAVLTLILLAVTLFCAWLLHQVTDLPTSHLVLAYAPGGLAEMSLVALALSFDASFVATHHLVRILLVVMLAPAVFRFLDRRASRKAPSKI